MGNTNSSINPKTGRPYPKHYVGINAAPTARDLLRPTREQLNTYGSKDVIKGHQPNYGAMADARNTKLDNKIKRGKMFVFICILGLIVIVVLILLKIIHIPGISTYLNYKKPLDDDYKEIAAKNKPV